MREGVVGVAVEGEHVSRCEGWKEPERRELTHWFVTTGLKLLCVTRTHLVPVFTACIFLFYFYFFVLAAQNSHDQCPITLLPSSNSFSFLLSGYNWPDLKDCFCFWWWWCYLFFIIIYFKDNHGINFLFFFLGLYRVGNPKRLPPVAGKPL